MSESSTTILFNRFQFIHIQDKNTGIITLHEGPNRIQLESHQEVIDGVQDKVRVHDGQFAIVLNPFSEENGDIIEGEREVRLGPTVFALYPGETLEANGKGATVQDEFVLDDSEALLLRAVKDAPHPWLGDEQMQAGDEVLLKGPCRYIPHKNIRIKEQRTALSLSESEGVYVQNDDTGAVRLERGPKDIFIEHNETLWQKQLSTEELQALGYLPQERASEGIRTLTPVPHQRNKDYQAIVVELEDQEAIYLYDDDNVRVEFGPKTVFLKPHERPKVLHISGGVPVKPKMLRIARLHMGPDFIRDVVKVRTRDNATLKLEVTYRWRFEPLEGEHEKLFALKDFVGFIARTLSAEIRAEAAKHNFEDFHAEAGQLINQAVIGDNADEGRIFSENNMIIFGVDVESIVPEDENIKAELSTAILTNVEIYTKSVREQAELARERDLIEGQTKNEQLRQALIDEELANHRKRRLAHVEADAEAERILAEAHAEAIRIRAKAELEAEQERLKALTNLLATQGGSAYIDLERARVLRATDKVIVPTDSRIFLGATGNIIEDDD
jgi:regulator of protease activity HflC (stomatin/prohibitin superfamily)